MSLDAVTVSVTNYNGAAYLPWCLEAVKNLDPRPSEILVVDNASTDGSVALLKEHFPEVRLISVSKNEGPCPARNLGLMEANHPLVFQIDCDIAPHPDCLRRLLEAMQQGGEDVAICQPRAVFDSEPDRVHYDGAWFHYVGAMNLIHFYADTASLPEDTRELDAVISMALLVRKDSILEIGGYDPSFFILFEDHDLSYRLRMEGQKLLSVPKALCYHREGTAGVSFRQTMRYPRKRAFLQSRNRWIVLLKNHRLRTLILSLPGLMLFEAAWLAFSIREGFFLDFLKGKLSFLCLFPRVLAERRKIQASRVIKDRDLLGARDFTFSPLIKKSGIEAGIERTMNRVLRWWWNRIKNLIG